MTEGINSNKIYVDTFMAQAKQAYKYFPKDSCQSLFSLTTAELVFLRQIVWLVYYFVCQYVCR